MFRDITTLLLDADGLADDHRANGARRSTARSIWWRGSRRAVSCSPPRVADPAQALACCLIRKDGKLPGVTIAEDYALEYGEDRIAMHADACAPGARVLLVDDLIATGGTARAAVRLLRKAGAVVRQAQFLVDLPDLGGADALRADDIAVDALIAFPGH